MKKIKVTVEYWGGWSNTTANQYKVVKIVGAVKFACRVGLKAPPKDARVGDLLPEGDLEAIGSNTEITVVPKPL